MHRMNGLSLMCIGILAWAALPLSDTTSSSSAPSHLMPRFPAPADTRTLTFREPLWPASGNRQSPVNVRRSYWTAFWGSAWAKRYLRSKRAGTQPIVWHIAPPAAKDHREVSMLPRGVLRASSAAQTSI
jgi:hypothetical protein